MLANLFEQPNVFGRIGSPAFGIKSDRSKSTVFAKERRNKYATIIFHHFFRYSHQIQFRRRVTHRPSICNDPTGYAVAYVHPPVPEDIRVFARHVGRHRPSGFLVYNKDNTGIKRNNGPKLIGDKCYCVVKVQRRTDGLRDLMKSKHFALRLCDGSESGNVIIGCAQQIGRETRVGFRVGQIVVSRRFRIYLFLNIFRGNKPIEFLHVLYEYVHDAWIKSASLHASEQPQRFLALHSFAIWTVAARRIVEVDNGNDSRHQRNGFSFEAFWITTAIPFFMVVANDVFHRVGKVNAPENVATDSWMDFHLGELSLSQLAWFVENVFGHRQFTDVM